MNAMTDLKHDRMMHLNVSHVLVVTVNIVQLSELFVFIDWLVEVLKKIFNFRKLETNSSPILLIIICVLAGVSIATVASYIVYRRRRAISKFSIYYTQNVSSNS